MNSQAKKFLRIIIQQVHPDKFGKHPVEQRKNSESLKVLNAYIDRLARGRSLSQQRLEFCTVDGEHISTVEAVLPASGNLGSLFYAFGLVSKAESAHQSATSGQVDVRFLDWLAGIVSQASKTAAEHHALSATADKLTTEIQTQFNLSSIIATGPTSLRVAYQQQHVEALEVLQQCLSELCQDQPDMLAGLFIFLHHPDNKSWWGSKGSYVEHNGSVTLIADPKSLRKDLLRLDWGRARQLRQLSSFWAQEVSDKEAALTDLLGVRNVYFWSSKQHQKEMFVKWAAKILEHRSARVVQRRSHSFDLLVEAEHSLPVLKFDDRHAWLQVTTDCSPEQLLEYLQGSGATAASTAAAAHGRARREEERLLQAASKALGTQSTMRLCSRSRQPDINRSLQQLIATADAVREAYDLSGFAIAIDDCYSVTDSGLISIPWDFSTQDLKPQLRKLLSPGSVKALPPSASSGARACHTSCMTAEMRQRAASGNHATQSLFTQLTGARLFTKQSHVQKWRHTACHQSHMRLTWRPEAPGPSQPGCTAHLCRLRTRLTPCNQSLRLA